MASSTNRVPRLIQGVDVTTLPLSPLEGFVLSRIDGTVSLSGLADLTSLEDAQVIGIVDKLIELGAVEWARETVSLPLATGRDPTKTPSREVPIPEFLRRPRAKRPRKATAPIRIVKPSERPGGGTYRSEGSSERVETHKSVYPSSAPRASHTGSIYPAGEVVDPASNPGLRAPMRGPKESTGKLPAVGPASETPPSGPPSEGASKGERTPPAEAAATFDPRDFAPADASGSSQPPSEPSEPEELDLPEERRVRIDALHAALDVVDHYQVLGVERTSKRKEIRTAYFALSKVFHPDTMFRKRLGPYKTKMEAIFQRLTEAYEVLGKKKRRLEYDRYLDTQDRTRRVEQSLGEASADAPSRRAEEVKKAQAELAGQSAGRAAPATAEPLVPEPEPPSASNPTSIPTPEPAPAEVEPNPGASAAESPAAESPAAESSAAESGTRARRRMSPEAIAQKKRLMASRLRGAVKASNRGRRPKAESAEAPVEDRPRVGRERALRDLATTLKGSMTGVGSDRARRLQLQAERAERAGDLTGAMQHLRQALAEDPERPAIKAHHDRIEKQIASELAESYEEQALYESKNGKWGAAALSWSKVVAGRPDDVEALRRAADALLKAKGDLHKARDYARRAVELAPEDVRCMTVLARVYIDASLPLNARRILEQAAALAPEDRIVEGLLRDVGA